MYQYGFSHKKRKNSLHNSVTGALKNIDYKKLDSVITSVAAEDELL